MEEFVSYFSDIDELLTHLIKLILAFLFALPIGYNRERVKFTAGLRTIPLVAIGAAAFVLMSQAVLENPGPDATARIIQGLMAGIGFIGGGAILKEGVNVKGTATAAAIWVTGAMGASVAHGEFLIAIILSLTTFLIFFFLSPLKEQVEEDEEAVHVEKNEYE